MNTQTNDVALPENMVYVRPVAIEELPDEVRGQAAGMEHVYAVHNALGERLALVRDRRLAFVLARQHDLSPVSVH
ncbi:DUF1150 family protein [Roseitranquillus sediminis]|uniref:DUF1150 family protein n=1 Tax=Roseitranquillus sediminis TaxID=2809051 RepID=UPI001D0CBBEA|nr:DUF1150 family protein [Roseitranquillus sediminis]MBM9594440.1 DUF1150 family protein [Roseitranquillus sediminis]